VRARPSGTVRKFRICGAGLRRRRRFKFSDGVGRVHAERASNSSRRRSLASMTAKPVEFPRPAKLRSEHQGTCRLFRDACESSTRATLSTFRRFSGESRYRARRFSTRIPRISSAREPSKWILVGCSVIPSRLNSSCTSRPTLRVSASVAE
jgi:hypothetical protein